MTIDTVIYSGDRQQSPFLYAWHAQEKPATQAAPAGTFEEALRLAMARAK